MMWFSAQVVCVVGAVQAVQLGLVTFVWVGPGNRRANRLLGWVFGLLGLLLGLAAFRFGPTALTAFRYPFVHLWGTAAMAVSPLIYLYLRVSVGGYVLGARSLLHFLPSLIHLCLLLPLAWADAETRTALIQRYHELALYRTFIPGVRIGALQAVAYWSGCFWWVRRLERHIADTASFSDQLHLLWLKWFTGLLVVMLAVMAFGKLVLPGAVEVWAAFTFTGFLSAVTMIALAKPSLLHGLPPVLQIPEPEVEAAATAVDDAVEPDTQDPRQQALYTQLCAYCHSVQPYLREDLTLDDLCQALGASRTSLSQVINSQAGKHFYDFINDFRIEEAKKRLRDPACDHLGVDGIALDVGFRSRSAFFTAFKKRTGCTPSVWRAGGSAG